MQVKALNQLVRGTKAWRWCSLKKAFPLYSWDFHLANHGQCSGACASVSLEMPWDAWWGYKRPAPFGRNSAGTRDMSSAQDVQCLFGRFLSISPPSWVPWGCCKDRAENREGKFTWCILRTYCRLEKVYHISATAAYMKTHGLHSILWVCLSACGLSLPQLLWKRAPGPTWVVTWRRGSWAHQGMDILWVNRHVDLCLP